MKSANKEISRDTAQSLINLLQEGKANHEIEKELAVSKELIAVIEHTIAVTRTENSEFKRFHELEKESEAWDEEANDYTAKKLAKWLVISGLHSGQVHICTGLSIHKCRHLAKQVRKRYPIQEALIPIPNTLVARLIMSIFASHYLYLQEVTDSDSLSITNATVAWARTTDEVISNRLNELDDYDPRLLTLGSLVEVARGIREVKASGVENPYSESKKIRKLSKGICPACKSQYIWFSSKKFANSHCCYCELAEGFSNT